jgi:hypothetical protein
MVEALEHFMEISRIENQRIEPSAGSADRRANDLSTVAETGSSPGSLLLHRNELPPSTPCRFLPAHTHSTDL